MTINERVEKIRAVCPGYTKPIDSYCNRPEWYGVRRTAEAEAAIAKPKKDRHRPCYKLSVRIPESFVDMSEFHEQLIAMGYAGFTGWIKACIRRQQEEYKHRMKGKSPVATANSDEAKDKNISTQV